MEHQVAQRVGLAGCANAGHHLIQLRLGFDKVRQGPAEGIVETRTQQVGGRFVKKRYLIIAVENDYCLGKRIENSRG